MPHFDLCVWAVPVLVVGMLFYLAAIILFLFTVLWRKNP